MGLLLLTVLPDIILLRDVFVPPRLMNDPGELRVAAVVVSDAPVHGQFGASCLWISSKRQPQELKKEVLDQCMSHVTFSFVCTAWKQRKIA